MSNFPIYHGITLAANAYVENMHVEQLASDPVPVAAGRVWYNTTDKVWKQSTLDAGGAVIIRTFATAEALQAAVDSLNTTIGVLGNLVTTDKTNVVSAINEVKTQVNALGNAFNYVSTVTGGADAANAFDMATLTEKDAGDYYKVGTAGWFKVGAGAAFYANANDGLVFNLASGVDKIDNTDSAVAGTADYITVTGSTDSGYTVDVAATFKSRMSTAETDIDQLQSDVGTVANLATTAKTIVPAINELSGQVNGKIGDLSTLTTNAKTTIVAALNEVDGNVDAAQAELDVTQTGAGLNTDGTYSANASSNYLTAATSLKDADNKLDAQLKTVADALAQEVTDRTTADTAIRTDYNARRFTFSSASAATSHTVSHNLNSQFVDFTVWVERADGSWRNDIVSVRATDANTLTVYLSSAANVKLSVTSMANL